MHAGVRLMGVRGRCEVRGVAIGVMSTSAHAYEFLECVPYQYSGVVWTHEVFLGSLDRVNWCKCT